MSVLAALAGATLMVMLVAWLLGLDFFNRKIRSEPDDEVEIAFQRIEKAQAPKRFTSSTVAAAVALFFIVMILAAILTSSVILGFVLGLLAGSVPLIIESRKKAKELAERNAAWPDAIRQLISSLRAPMSVHASLLDLGVSGPLPLRPAFRTYSLLTRRLDPNQALDMVRRDLADPVSDRIIEVLILSFEQGAAVTLDVLDELAESVTEYLRLNETIRTMMMDVKIDAAAIAIIPFGLLLATLAIMQEWRNFYSSAGGQLVLLLCMGWTALGVTTILYVIRVRPEPRILEAEESLV